MSKIELNPTETVIQNVRLAFPALFEKKPTAKGSEKTAYQATLYLPPNFDVKPLHACMIAAMKQKFGKVLKLDPSKNPIKSGATKEWDGLEDDWHFIRSKSQFQPGVVDQRVAPIIDPDQIYAGCWVNAKIHAFAYDHPTGGKGVSFGLDMIQFARHDDPLTRNSTQAAAKVFSPIEIDDDEDFGEGSSDSASAGGSNETDEDIFV